VVRNHAGNFVEACGDCFRHVTSPELAEALAIRLARSPMLLRRYWTM
jgi:hypothetical protein